MRIVTGIADTVASQSPYVPGHEAPATMLRQAGRGRYARWFIKGEPLDTDEVQRAFPVITDEIKALVSQVRAS